jgi:alginate O-acetyltransferase complex protein AlgI
MYAAMGRVVFGYFLIIPVSWATESLSGTHVKEFYQQAASHTQWTLAAVLFFSLVATIKFINLYINFAGYMHVVIGIGRMAGFQLPENFNHPFRSENMLDFWSRWHITLSEWFKFYLFNPLLKAVSGRWGSRERTPYLGVMTFFITFIVMGVWHGTSTIFLVYGLLLGLGVSANKLWQLQAVKVLGKAGYKDLCNNPLYRYFSRSATLGYFAVALTCIWIPPEVADYFTDAVGLGVGLSAIIALTVIYALALAFLDGAARLLRLGLYEPLAKLGLPHFTSIYGMSEVAMAVWTTVFIFIMLTLAALLNSPSPDFIYKGY